MTASPVLSIVLPVYNQADHLAAIVQEYRRELDRLRRPCELILVPNGCRDRSVEIAHRLADAHGDVRVAEASRPGWGHAVRWGIAVARGEIVGYTNLARTSAADLTLLAIYATAYPEVVVKANRKIREGMSRRLGALLYNLECRALFDLSCWDINGTPKFFPRRFDRLLALRRDDDLLDLEFAVTCRTAGYPLIEVPIFSTRRHGGRSTTRLTSAIRLYLGALAMRCGPITTGTGAIPHRSRARGGTVGASIERCSQRGRADRGGTCLRVSAFRWSCRGSTNTSF